MITIRTLPFFQLKSTWNRLYQANSDIFPYLSYKCHRILRILTPLRIRSLTHNLKYYVAYEDGDPICIMPLYGTTERSVFTSDGIAYVDFIYADSLSADTLSEILIELKKLVDLPLYFHNIPPNSKLLLADPTYTRQVSTYAIHFPDGYEAYKANLSKHVRQNIRTARNHLADAQKDCRTEVRINRPIPFGTRNEITKIAASRILEIVERDEGFINRHPRFNYYLRLLCYRVIDPVFTYTKRAKGNFLASLRIDGRIAAFMYGIVSKDGSSVMIPKLAHSSDYRSYSPGILLLDDTIRYLCENTDIRTIDLATGDEPYKMKMGAAENALYCIRR